MPCLIDLITITLREENHKIQFILTCQYKRSTQYTHMETHNVQGLVIEKQVYNNAREAIQINIL